MPETLALLLPILAGLASTAGAGVVASDGFAHVRAWFATQRQVADRPRWVARLLAQRRLAWLIESRIGARLTVMALACLISVGAAALLAALTGEPIGPALDKALAAIVASQVYHMKAMRGQISDSAAGFVFTPDPLVFHADGVDVHVRPDRPGKDDQE